VTDGQTDGIAIAYTRYSYAVARKNEENCANLATTLESLQVTRDTQAVVQTSWASAA